MEITGKIKKIMDVQQISDTFRKREFVLTVDYNSPYPQYVLFQTIQDKCSMLDNLKVNDEVKVFFNIRGREWINPQDNQPKYFVSLEAWRIDKFTPVSGETSSYNTESYASKSSSFANVSTSAASNESDTDIQTASDDLPF